MKAGGGVGGGGGVAGKGEKEEGEEWRKMDRVRERGELEGAMWRYV